MELKDSVTKENLLRAFAGESQARNRYTFAAGQAHQQGLYVLEQVFQFTADQEKEHAEVFYNQLKELAGETIAIEGSYPVDLSPNMLELLKMAQHNEYEEHDDVYQNFGDKASEEGAFAKLLEDNQLFISKVETKWMCLNCGYVYEGKEAPMSCPVCDHEQGWYVRLELAPYCGKCEGENIV